MLPGAVGAQAKTASRLGFPTPLPSPVAAMSPPFADQPAALPRAPSVLTMAAPFGDPGLTFTLLYSTGTARSSSAASLRVKGFALLITVLTLMCSSPPFGFALPPCWRCRRHPGHDWTHDGRGSRPSTPRLQLPRSTGLVSRGRLKLQLPCFYHGRLPVDHVDRSAATPADGSPVSAAPPVRWHA